jgi:hypothetical protein
MNLLGWIKKKYCENCGESSDGQPTEAYDGFGCDGCMWQYEDMWVPKGKTHESEGKE